MELVTSVLIDTPILFKQDKSIVFIYNPGSMSTWIRGYPTKDSEDANNRVYFDIVTGWKVTKLDDFINIFDLNQGDWKVHSQGWFTDKMNKVLDNYCFGSSVTRILKSMDILIHRYNLKVIQCFIDLNRGVLVYTIRTIDEQGPKDGMIVFENTLEIEAK